MIPCSTIQRITKKSSQKILYKLIEKDYKQICFLGCPVLALEFNKNRDGFLLDIDKQTLEFAGQFRDNTVQYNVYKKIPKELAFDHKEILKFDGLIIAVGGKPRIPENLAVFSDVMLTLKTRKSWKW